MFQIRGRGTINKILTVADLFVRTSELQLITSFAQSGIKKGEITDGLLSLQGIF